MTPHHRRIRRVASVAVQTALGAAVLTGMAAAAAAQTFSGSLGDPGNAALVGIDLGAPVFIDAAAIADNTALYPFALTVAGPLAVSSSGFAAGGIDPYVTIFRGADAGAAFIGSNYEAAFSNGGDFAFSLALPAGAYQLAIGTFANLSRAENQGSGSLADGFIGLGQATSLGTGGYRVLLTTPVPEPAPWALLAISLCGLCGLVRVAVGRAAGAATWGAA